MTISRHETDAVLQLNQGPPENSCRPAVDVLFRSVAQVYGSNVLAVVMTGMGCDGARGAAQVKESGGEVLVQDEASSVVWGMPGAVVSQGDADKICPLGDISQEIVRRVTTSRTHSRNTPPDDVPARTAADARNGA
jgi:two-component system chemotaxis response regulator CheB